MNNRKDTLTIAKFLGWKEQTDPTERFFGMWRHPNMTWHKEDEVLSILGGYEGVMAAIEKIEALGYWTEVLSGTGITKMQIGKINTMESVVEYDSDVKTEALYKTVLEFIDWLKTKDR